MRIIFHVTALAGFACGVRHFRRFLGEHRKNRLLEKKIAVWESEGGAVAIEPTRTAAQVSPLSTQPLSPRDVN